MKKVYPVLFTKTNDDKDTILIEVPDLGAMTEGYGMADAIEMARDVIGMAGITKEDNGEELPEATEFDKVDAAKGTFAADGETYASLVDVDFDVYRRKVDMKSVRRNVTLPNWLNVEADKAGINVSKVLQDALMSVLNVSRG